MPSPSWNGNACLLYTSAQPELQELQGLTEEHDYQCHFAVLRHPALPDVYKRQELRSIIPHLKGTNARYEHIDRLPRLYPAVEMTRTKAGEHRIKTYNGLVLLLSLIHI